MNRTRRATLAALMVALIVAAGYSLVAVPNVELVTFLVFASGFLLATRLGALVGAFAWGLYSTLNPMGVAVPPVLVAQVACGALVGAAGGFVGPKILERKSRLLGMLLSGLTGLSLTLIFQVVVNAAAFFAAVGTDERTFTALRIFVVAGMAFTAMHLVWNAAVFTLALKPVMSVLNRYRVELR